MRSLLNRVLAALAVAMLVLAGFSALAPTAGAVAVSQAFQLPSSGTFEVTGHGNGHAHGMSQYGAKGAALGGLSTEQILAFYYPGTTLTTLSPVPTIRVQVSGGYTQTCIEAKAGLTATGVTDPLPSTGSLKIAPDANGLDLLAYSASRCAGAPTQTWAQPAANTIDVSSADGFVRLLRADATATDYYGSLGAARNGAGQVTINRVSLDLYAQGVAPREMPSGWPLSAVQAQTIAARSYAGYELEHAGANDLADICDSTNCQVYGGKTHFDASGRATWSDFPAGAASNSGMVLTYSGKSIFAQYSASNGGWMVDGGQPYLVSKQDPYDNAASGDPYLNWTKSVSSASIASRYGLQKVTSLQVSARDGNGDFGGRVQKGAVVGTNASGATISVAATGFGLMAAMGLSDNWFTLRTLPVTANLTGYVQAASDELFGAVAPDPSVAPAALDRLLGGTAPGAVTKDFAMSRTAATNALAVLAKSILGRTLSAKSAEPMIAKLQQGRYVDVEIALFASDEYYKRYARNRLAFAKGLTGNDLIFGRKLSATSLSLVTKQLKKSKTRTGTVSNIVKSRESVQRTVNKAAKAVLGRSLSASENAAWRQMFVALKYNPLTLRAAMLADNSVLAKYGMVGTD